MLKEITSTLKNKSNSIYLIIIILLFIILNITLNLNSFINTYYDLQVKDYIDNAIQTYNISYEELEKSFRTLQISSGSTTSVESLEELLNNKEQVKNISVEEIDFDYMTVDFIYIELNNWTDCIEIKQYLNNKGIDTYYQVEETFYENYKNITAFSNIIKYFSIIIVILILSISCNNIIKNEKQNIKNLIVFGYSKAKYKFIIFIKLFSITIIGLFIGIIFSQIFFYFINYNLNMNININILKDMIINLVIIIIIIFIMTNKKIFY